MAIFESATTDVHEKSMIYYGPCTGGLSACYELSLVWFTPGYEQLLRTVQIHWALPEKEG